jgi:hypothetical protein
MRLLLAVALACAFAGASAMIMAVDTGSEFTKVAVVKPGMPFQVCCVCTRLLDACAAGM